MRRTEEELTDAAYEGVANDIMSYSDFAKLPISTLVRLYNSITFNGVKLNKSRIVSIARRIKEY